MRCRKSNYYILLPSEENVKEPAPSCNTGGAINGSIGGCSGLNAVGSGTVLRELMLAPSFGDPGRRTAPSKDVGGDGDGDSRPFRLLGFGRREKPNLSDKLPPGDIGGGDDCGEPGSVAEFTIVAELAVAESVEFTGPPCDAGAVDCESKDRGPEAAASSKAVDAATEEVVDFSRSSLTVVAVVRELTSSS
jgi:hypothetical protein